MSVRFLGRYGMAGTSHGDETCGSHPLLPHCNRKIKSVAPLDLRIPTLLVVISFVLLLSFISFSKLSISNLKKASDVQFSHCKRFQIQTHGEKFLWYAPHSGFSNQVSEFRNALLVAKILNRTVVVPPVLDHHAVALGSCPKFRVLFPNEIRITSWNHMIELLETGRYISMADIVDISSLAQLHLRTIDFRVFASLWCRVSIDDFLCTNDSKARSSVYEALRKCGSLLSGIGGDAGGCLQAVDHDCRSTVWIHDENGEKDGTVDSFQPDEQLKRKRRASLVRIRRDLSRTLGPGSEPEAATVLSFGSLFSAQHKGSALHIDIREPYMVPFLPFVSEILDAGRKLALEAIRVPFLCVQLRLLDGQFKIHREASFRRLKDELSSLKFRHSPQPVHIFVMTDLPRVNWSGSLLGELDVDSDSFKVHTLGREDELVVQTTRAVAVAGRGLRVPCPPDRLPDVLLCIEESVCSCAALGFVGTIGSTIAENVESMRKADVCHTHNH